MLSAVTAIGVLLCFLIALLLHLMEVDHADVAVLVGLVFVGAWMLVQSLAPRVR